MGVLVGGVRFTGGLACMHRTLIVVTGARVVREKRDFLSSAGDLIQAFMSLRNMM